MAKYNELLKEYSEEIQRIKYLETKQSEISQRLNRAYESTMTDIPMDCTVIEYEMANIQMELYQAQESLSAKVKEAYWDVPYAKPRKQGMAKFWELSGLSR